MIEVCPLETQSLGDRSYLAHDGDVALVIDPQRDVDRIMNLAREERVRISHVAETHIHNDYVTGGVALAAATGATYLVNAADPVLFERTPVRDGDVLEIGAMRVRVVHTPGHTNTHLSYVLSEEDVPVAVFTGGSLLYGSTGRSDLLGPDHTETLSHAQWRSVRMLADLLPDDTAVYPTHGFGSFCSVIQEDRTSSSIGREKQTNPALTLTEEDYVRDFLANLDAYPAYYAHMAPRNLAGPTEPDLSPPSVADPEELQQRIEAGEWVVDLRHRSAFAAGHVMGTLNIGLDGQFVTYLGWLIPWGTPVTVLGDTADDVAAAQRELVRIGIDRPAAMGTGGPARWSGRAPLAAFPRVAFVDLAEVLQGSNPPTVLDVRRHVERSNAYIPGSIHIPIHETLGRLDDVPAGPVWVHCTSGYRASVAASILAAHGRDVVLVDDNFAVACQLGLAHTGVRPARS